MACTFDMTLDEIGTEMNAICAEVKQIEAGGKTLTKDELADVKNRAELVVESLQYNHGVVTFLFDPEVPATTTAMFYELEAFVNPDFTPLKRVKEQTHTLAG